MACLGSALAATNTPPKEDPGPRQGAAQQPMELPEIKGVVSWKTLAEVTPVKQKDKFVPSFSRGIAQLDKKEVKLQGFMMPLEMGEKQKNSSSPRRRPAVRSVCRAGRTPSSRCRPKRRSKYGFDPVDPERQVQRAEGRSHRVVLPADRCGTGRRQIGGHDSQRQDVNSRPIHFNRHVPYLGICASTCFQLARPRHRCVTTVTMQA